MAVLANCAAPRAMGLHRGVHGVGTRTAPTTSLASFPSSSGDPFEVHADRLHRRRN
jgi:hypothetical protein